MWFDELASGRVHSLAEIARNEGIAKRYVERLSRLAFVTPAIVESICQGQQPAELNAETLLNRIDLPLEWLAQGNALGIKYGRDFQLRRADRVHAAISVTSGDCSGVEHQLITGCPVDRPPKTIRCCSRPRRR